jgi:putative oxidoreductase
MKARIPLVARMLLGLVFLFGSVTFFLNLIPPPADMPERLKTFNEGLMASGYFFNLLKATELICGLMLVTGFFVPLALVVLAPISLNIFLVHAILAPEGLPLAVIIGVLIIYLSFFAEPYASAIRPLFSPRP